MGFTRETAAIAGRKSRGGGRPRRELADLMDYGGEVAVAELIRIVDQGESHALYLDALRELSRTCLPRRRQSEVSGESGMTFVEVARQVFAGEGVG